jgi:uncharacterized circularly permuted ATP-grasp superfamily protein
VTLANAIGTGVARRQVDVSVRAGDDPLLPGRGADPQERADLLLRKPDDRKYVLEHLDELVVKEAQGSGGYGMLVGPPRAATSASATASASSTPRALHRAADALALAGADLLRRPLATAHVRPAALRAHRPRRSLRPGGLTRVALREGSLVVNSSQGGGVKDTWVVD